MIHSKYIVIHAEQSFVETVPSVTNTVKYQFELITECYPKHYQQIKANLDLIKYKTDDMHAAVERSSTAGRRDQGTNTHTA